MTAPVDILLSFYVFRWRESQRDIVFVLWFRLSLKQKKKFKRERNMVSCAYRLGLPKNACHNKCI